MTRITHKAWTLILVLLISVTTNAALVLAQEGKPKRTPPGFVPPDFPDHRPGMPPGQGFDRPFPPEPAFDFLSSEMRFGDKTVKGAPYSAEAITENTQTLSDGTRITRKASAKIYRDIEGRVRREQALSAIGPLVPSGGPAQMIFISDPVAGVHYFLDPDNRVARKMSAPTHRPPPPSMRPPSSSFERKTESLGKQTIEGVEAEGTRSIITIAVGQIGNDRPIEIVSERWDSPALQTVVLSKHSDPRIGQNTYRLTNINRSEPPHSLFEVPSDYTIEEGHPGPRPPMKDRERPREDRT